MQSNEYSAYDDSYNEYVGGNHDEKHHLDDEGEDGLLIVGEAEQASAGRAGGDAINFEDERISSLPRILLMGPRRGGKTSIQVRTPSAGYRNGRSGALMLASFVG